jgi:Zn-dependent protease with chaperone function
LVAAKPQFIFRCFVIIGMIGALPAALLLVTACAGVQHLPPEVSTEEKEAAFTEIETYASTSRANAVSQGEAEGRLHDVYVKLYPAAMEICRTVGESPVCGWNLSYSDLQEYNAFATEGNQVVVYHGIISDTDNNDELAFVVAHELGHHIADHINETRKRANTGALVSGLAMAALSHGSFGCSTYTCLNNVQQAAQLSMQAGGTLGALMFSVDQEKEADYLAARIMSLAGYDLAKSRNMMVKLGKKTKDKETGFFDSHPAGPERLASYDKTLEVVQNEKPSRPSDPATAARPDSKKKETEALKFDQDNCRIYLEEEGICIH